METKALRIADSNPLFEAYLNEFDKVKNFYHFNYQSDWDKAIQKRVDQKFDRKRIAEILTHQSKKWNAPPRVLENISQLNSPNSFVVITGQQAGIFTGPLYTIYKILTTLKLSNWLESKYPNYSFIPCFWMEVDDHDFKEINHIHFFNKNNELQRLELSEESGDALKPIYTRHLNSEISAWKSAIKDEFHETEFMGDILEKFFGKYSTGQFYPDAFAQLILELVGNSGLVAINPSDPEIKELGKPIYTKVAEAPNQIQEQLKTRSESLLKANLPVQIQLQSNQTLLFYTDNKNQRIRIDFEENGNFLLKYNKGYEKLEKNKLIRIIEETPERISANVALRPLIQDFILPTVGYIAGPAEIAYFAQLSALYDHLNQTMPIVYPRHRITIVENKIQRIVEKLEIDMAELFQRRSEYLEFFIQQKQNEQTFGEIENLRAEITKKLNQLQKIVEKTDPTLVNAVQKTEEKTHSNIEQVINKITNSLKQKEATETEQLKRTLLFLLPENNYQERILNIIYFLIKYGPDFINALYEKLPLDSQRHYLINL